MQLLRQLRSRVRRMDPLRADVLLALVFLVESQLEVLLLVGDVPDARVAQLSLAGVAVGLALRRRAPLASVIVAMTGFTVVSSLERPVADNVYSVFFACLFVMFSFGLHERDRRRVAAGIAVAFASSMIGQVVDSYPSTAIDYVFAPAVIAAGPILLARVIRHRARLNQALREKADHLRRDRTAQAELAAAQERSRIAGELHDVVAHAMSAMVVQAGGARRLAERDPARARDAFGAVELTGREALTEIRRLLGVLRHEDEAIGLAPQPSLRHLASLIERTRSAGLPVELEVDGDERDLPPGVDLTAYRVLQEALGGALDPGAAGSARVTVRYRPDALDLEVVDDGAGGDGRRALPGVRERVSLYGGRLDAGRRRGGGHAVRAHLPVGGAS